MSTYNEQPQAIFKTLIGTDASTLGIVLAIGFACVLIYIFHNEKY